jgi:hypothetical protein
VRRRVRRRGRSGRSCGPRAARTLALTARARVYASGGDVFGCARGTHRSYRLGGSGSSVREGRVGPVALAGLDASYGLAHFGVDAGSSQVLVRRLSDGRRLRSLPAVTRPQRPESYSAVDSVVVKADGSVAWIATARSILGGSPDIEVHRADRRGRALLDAGPRIDAGSLRLRGSWLRWRDGGVTRSATLR